jgi:hypothetical protein
VRPPSILTGRWTGGWFVRALAVVGLSFAYFSSIFQIFRQEFWTSGMGDWMDPYFVNSLLEHWAMSIVRLNDPSSPLMFFPTPKTLGYSHGLVQYAPIYVPLRVMLHPFQAYNLTIFIVMVSGAASLYALFRIHFRLSFVESLLLAALFTTSANVVNGAIIAWSQRASIFLVPLILLILAVSYRMRDGWPKLVLGFVGGLMALLLFVQDFYTAQFTAFFAVLFLTAHVVIERAWSAWSVAGTVWTPRSPRWRSIAAIVAILTLAWAILIFLSGGGEVSILGERIRSHDWRRPALIGLTALLVFVYLRGGFRVTMPAWVTDRWFIAVMLGSLAGACAFLWIYLEPYSQFGSFPEEELARMLISKDLSRWRTFQGFLRDVHFAETMPSFALVVVAAALAWIPWLNRDRTARFYGLWFVFVALLTFFVPLSVNGFSIWRTFFAPIPGFASIRDPARIIFAFELAAVLAVAVSVSRPSVKAAYRIAVTATVLILLTTGRAQGTFSYGRSNQIFDRWVSAPIDIDPSCSSFFVQRASPEYASRSDHKWTLYALDATFIAMKHSIPTLNGYSAWVPPGYHCLDPEDHGYMDDVDKWIHQNVLTGVCVLDVDARTMRPYRPSS